MCKIGDRWVVNPSGGLLSKGDQNYSFLYLYLLLCTSTQGIVITHGAPV